MKKLLPLLLLGSFILLGASSDENSLRVSASGPGSVEVEVHVNGATESVICTNVCNYNVAGGSSITLSPLPKKGARFTGWSDACQRSPSACSLSIDPGVSGENLQTTARFQFLNQSKPFLKKQRKLRSNSLPLLLGCGGGASCSLGISGKLKGGAELEPVFFDLRSGEKRKINVLQGKANAPLRKSLQRYVKNKRKAQLSIFVRDIDTGMTARMAINEKPPCCPWPKKSNK